MSGPDGAQADDWYRTPRDYDDVFDQDTSVEAEFLEAAFDEHATPSPRGRRRALEPAAGSGRLMLELAQRGWRVHGFDLEPAMVRYARERLAAAGRPGTVARGDMACFTARGTFDLAHCLVSTFKYLPSEEAARSHLECVAGALRPGGIYVLGLHLTDYRRAAIERERWVVERAGRRVVCTITGWAPERALRRERMRSTLTVTERGQTRRTRTDWWLRTYSARQVRALIRTVPALEIAGTYDFHHRIDEPQPLDDRQGDSVLVLRKRP